jgi:ABC-type transporter Mla subunit MlaD
MSGPNGPDIAAVYQLLTQIAGTVSGHDGKLDELSVEVGSLRQTVAGLNDIVAGHDRKLDDLAAGIASLRDTVTHYHSSVLGHGILISELDERVRRIERHLKLEPASD